MLRLTLISSQFGRSRKQSRAGCRGASASTPALLAIWLAIAPEHGTLTVRRAMLKATNLKQCLATEVPAFVAFYRAAAGSNTEDRFELEVNYSAGRSRRSIFTSAFQTLQTTYSEFEFRSRVMGREHVREKVKRVLEPPVPHRGTDCQGEKRRARADGAGNKGKHAT